jgi:hypothetical protein
MRSLTLILVFALLAGGCATKGPQNLWKEEATRIGITQEAVAAIARQASERHKMVVVRITKLDSEKDAILVYLADKPDRPHGIGVIYRLIAGEWQEDPKSQGDWII